MYFGQAFFLLRASELVHSCYPRAAKAEAVCRRVGISSVNRCRLETCTYDVRPVAQPPADCAVKLCLYSID